MAVKDEWVRAAMEDENVVAELLLRMKQAQAPIPAKKRAVTTLKWGVRQLRSRATLTRCGGKRDGDFSTRCSPNTPLSWWSGGNVGSASPSTADGFEATSRPLPSRSKYAAVVGNEAITSTTKRIRRKKTLAEVKEEENLLLKERSHLQKEIASMHAIYKEQRAKNEHLKMLKVLLLQGSLLLWLQHPRFFLGLIELPLSWCQTDSFYPPSCSYQLSFLPFDAAK